MSILGGLGGGMRGGFGGGAGGGGKAGGGGTVPYVTERDFEAQVLTSDLPVLVEFTADWCQPCKTIAPEVEAFAKEVEGKVKVVKVDIDKSQFLAKQLRIQSVPTFMLFANQRLADAQVGAIDRKGMRAMVEPFLPRQAGALKAVEVAQLVAQGAAVPVDTRDASAFGRAHIPQPVLFPASFPPSIVGHTGTLVIGSAGGYELDMTGAHDASDLPTFLSVLRTRQWTIATVRADCLARHGKWSTWAHGGRRFGFCRNDRGRFIWLRDHGWTYRFSSKYYGLITTAQLRATAESVEAV